MRPPRLRCTLFPLIYPPHLLVLPATFGLYLRLQTYPYFRALYVISVRRTKSLPMTSFRFHLTMDTLVNRLYTSSLPRRIWDFHPLERAHGAQTNRDGLIYHPSPAFNSKSYFYYLSAIYAALATTSFCSIRSSSKRSANNFPPNAPPWTITLFSRISFNSFIRSSLL